ncbi:transcription termination/antitermination protein NusG [uncultured Treponema sp.]|uniref:transcription termination/antitermination protein NusG n=1 Tax=uncultured Treponema sp. TaxID=162155 RepID=UPI0015BBA2E6|nr:hypothetical protein [uncultured Treponema sp.]
MNRTRENFPEKTDSAYKSAYKSTYKPGDKIADKNASENADKDAGKALTESASTAQKNFYCLYIRTGLEWDFVKEMQPVLDSNESPCKGKLYCLGKQMRLKNGKEYIDTIFPSYVFWETDSFEGFSVLQKGKGFVKILPHNSEPAPLNSTDVSVVCSFLKYGTVMPIVHVDFDVNDRIQILDGLFKGQEGLVVAVNRRNKRVNLEIQFMNGTRVIGLSYELIKKVKE